MYLREDGSLFDLFTLQIIWPNFLFDLQLSQISVNFVNVLHNQLRIFHVIFVNVVDKFAIFDKGLNLIHFNILILGLNKKKYFLMEKL